MKIYFSDIRHENEILSSLKDQYVCVIAVITSEKQAGICSCITSKELLGMTSPMIS